MECTLTAKQSIFIDTVDYLYTEPRNEYSFTDRAEKCQVQKRQRENAADMGMMQLYSILILKATSVFIFLRTYTTSQDTRCEIKLSILYYGIIY